MMIMMMIIIIHVKCVRTNHHCVRLEEHQESWISHKKQKNKITIVFTSWTCLFSHNTCRRSYLIGIEFIDETQNVFNAWLFVLSCHQQFHKEAIKTCSNNNWSFGRKSTCNFAPIGDDDCYFRIWFLQWILFSSRFWTNVILSGWHLQHVSIDIIVFITVPYTLFSFDGKKSFP